MPIIAHLTENHISLVVVAKGLDREDECGWALTLSALTMVDWVTWTSVVTRSMAI